MNGCEEQIDDKTPPEDVILYTIEYTGSEFLFRWSLNHDNDFKSYKLYESETSDMAAYQLIYESENPTDTTYTYFDPKPGVTSYFQVVVSDKSENVTRSLVRAGYGQKTFYANFGGAGSEYSVSVIETPDSGYALVGTIFNGTDFDIMLVRVNSDGQEEWTAYYGESGWDIATSLCLATDNGFTISGYTTGKGAGKEDGWVIRTDSDGNQLWDQVYGNENNNRVNDAMETPDGGYILSGSTQSSNTASPDGWLIKIDASGNQEWSVTAGDTAYDAFSSVVITESGYAAAGTSKSYSGIKSDIWVVGFDPAGTEIWSNIYGGNDEDAGRSIILASDGNLVVAGTRESDSGINTNSDAWLGKIGTGGSLIWQNWFGSTGYDEGADVIETNDGNFIMTGYTTSYGYGKYDVLLVKADATGSRTWVRSFGGAEIDRGLSLQRTFDGGFIIAGDTESFGGGGKDFWLLKTNPGGIIVTEY